MTYPHIPILVKEFLEFFRDKKLSIFVDVTLGAAGHSAAILEAHPEIEQFIGIDQDPYALEIASERLKPFGSKVILKQGNFSNFNDLVPFQVDGIFADIGVSSMQIDQAERGMSFSKNGPLDMRMDPTRELTAEIIVNSWSEEKLGTLFREYGEEPKWKLAAQAIISARKVRPITTTKELVAALSGCLKYNPKKQLNPMTLIFQALRIAVNEELKALEAFLPQAHDHLRSGGRFGILSFHSLEDRIIKNYFRQISGYKGGRDHNYIPEETVASAELLTKKPITPTDQEISHNPRSRSCKMRFIEKL